MYSLQLKNNYFLNEHLLNHSSASNRIAIAFIELLEKQFPIDDKNNTIHLRSASDFASHLNVHVNHLNRVVKKTTGKTTSSVISDRVLLEAKRKLIGSTSSVSEIAYSLGFLEVTHFNNFFKGRVNLSPLQFRNETNII